MKLNIEDVNFCEEIDEMFEAFSPHFPLGKVKISIYHRDDSDLYHAFSNIHILNDGMIGPYSNTFSYHKEKALEELLQQTLEGLEEMKQSPNTSYIEWEDSRTFE